MRAFSVLSAALLLSLNAWAATVIEPTQGSTWDATSQGQKVAWTSVPTDPTSFSLMLANTQVYPNLNILLKQNVSTSDGSTTVNGPPSGWPTGNGFQINIVQQNPTGVAILAQSQQFNINGTTVAFSSVKPSGTSTGSSPSSTSTSTKNGDLGLTVQTGFVAGLALVGALLA